MMNLPNSLTLTEAAASRAKDLLSRDDGVIGLRVGVAEGGCSGMKYQVEFAREQKPLDQVVEDKGIKLFVDPMALMFLVGSEMDYEEDKFTSGFIFNNPNETGRCGCGESFLVDREQLAKMKEAN